MTPKCLEMRARDFSDYSFHKFHSQNRREEDSSHEQGGKVFDGWKIRRKNERMKNNEEDWKDELIETRLDG